MSDHYRNAEDFVCDESFQRYCLGTDQSAIDHWESWIMEHPEASGEIAEARKIFSMLNGRQGNLREQARELKDGMERSMLLKEESGQREAACAATPVLYAGMAIAASRAGDKRAFYPGTATAAAGISLIASYGRHRAIRQRAA